MPQTVSACNELLVANTHGLLIRKGRNTMNVPTNEGFVERNRWKLLLGVPLSFAVNGLGISTGVAALSFIAWVAFPILLFCALGGFVARGVTKNEERRRSQGPRPEYSGPPSVTERSVMMDRIIQRHPR